MVFGLSLLEFGHWRFLLWPSPFRCWNGGCRYKVLSISSRDCLNNLPPMDQTSSEASTGIMTKLTFGLQMLLAASPLFLLTMKGWISGILFASSALAIVILLSVVTKRDSPIFPGRDNWLWCFVILFSLPVAAIFLGQSGRQEYAWRDYDSPARFLLSVPILLVLFQHRCDMLKWLVYTIPAATFITVAAVMLNPNDVWEPQGNIRASRHFVDPIKFGSLSLTLGLCCFLSIDLYERDKWWMRLYKGTGFIAGVYLSVLSGSRTGWMAIPLVLVLWLNLRMTRYRAAAIISVLLLLGGTYLFSTTVQQRLDLAGQQILSYQWNAANPATSVGDRLSFLRMAVFLFMQKPWSGFGDQGFVEFINHPELNRYALQETQEQALRSGFHNEIAINMVRSGVWGLLSSSALFVLPAVLFIRSLKSASLQIKNIGMLALGYLVCTFISGLTIDVFNLKFMASFHALMFTCFISSLLVHHAVDQRMQRNEST